MFKLAKGRGRLYTLTILVIALAVAGVVPSAIHPARASAVFAVNLDANSTSQADIIVTPSAFQNRSFRVGAIINASTTNPLSGVFGWQFGIDYNASAFLPQGDPSLSASYPDGAASTVLFGSQGTPGTINWAALASSGIAFASFNIYAPGEIFVFFTLVGQRPTVTISAKTLLANVNFELLNRPTSPQYFNVSDVIFDGPTGLPLTGLVDGRGAYETITNDPPHARFNVAPASNGSPSAFTFDASTSYDGDGTIANPGGYFWDFGDGTQDLGVTGSKVTHDYGVNGSFVASLRVQDNLGATGAARDTVGNVIVNSQPSHSFKVTGSAPDERPIARFSISPRDPGVGQTARFDASNSTDPDGVIVSYHWDFGDGSVLADQAALETHAYALPGNYTVVLTVLDYTNMTGSSSMGVAVSPTIIAVDTNPQTPGIQNMSSVSGSFNVDVDLVDAPNLDSWQFQLNYDNTLLSTSAANVTLAPLWQSILLNHQGLLTLKVNQALGSVQVGITGFNLNIPGITPLATIGFSSLRNGTGLLHLASATINGNILATARDGVVVTSTSPDEDPVSAFTFSPSSPSSGDSVVFDGTNSSDPDGFIQSWSWSFGDNSFSSGPRVSHSYSSAGNYTASLTVLDSAGRSATTIMIIHVRSSLPDEPPIASFAFSPAKPLVGDNVFFGSNSSDPDGFILSLAWSFGDSSGGFGPFVSHSYNSPGNYTVSLTVQDSSGQSASTSKTIQVRARPLHDVAVVRVSAYPQIVVSSQAVSVEVDIVNNGLSNETVSVTAYYGSNVIGSVHGIFLRGVPPGCSFCGGSAFVRILWDTSGVVPGNYTISATVFLPTDQNPSDNTLKDGQVQVLPPPILAVTPSSGVPGTTVLVQGSHFPPIPQGYGGFSVIVSFDDQLIGFTNTQNGSFNFTFSIPLSQGPHLIKALDEITGAHASVSFFVQTLPSSVNLVASVEIGPVYFPGDTADIYVGVTLNGVSVAPAKVQLQLLLVSPDGTNLTLVAKPVPSGLLKASFAVPKTKSIGTYVLIARVRSASLYATAFQSFEVKPSWLTQQGPTIVSATALTGLVGIVAVAWRKGYLKKKDEPSFAF